MDFRPELVDKRVRVYTLRQSERFREGEGGVRAAEPELPGVSELSGRPDARYAAHVQCDVLPLRGLRTLLDRWKGQLVVPSRNSSCTEGGDAPAMQGATSENTGSM